jgi:hypothetical protein
MVPNPFAKGALANGAGTSQITPRSNVYYRIFKVANLM